MRKNVVVVAIFAIFLAVIGGLCVGVYKDTMASQQNLQLLKKEAIANLKASPVSDLSTEDYTIWNRLIDGAKICRYSQLAEWVYVANNSYAEYPICAESADQNTGMTYVVVLGQFKAQKIDKRTRIMISAQRKLVYYAIKGSSYNHRYEGNVVQYRKDKKWNTLQPQDVPLDELFFARQTFLNNAK